MLFIESIHHLLFQFAPMVGFHIGDQLSFMEKLAKRYRTSVLHHLLASTKNTT
jgi:hypothetical protein